MLAPVDGQVAYHLGNLGDLTALYLLPVVFEPVVPVGGHLGGVSPENRECLLYALLVGAGPQARVTLGRDADRKLRVRQVHDVVAPDLAEDGLLLHSGDTPRAVVRVNHEVPLDDRPRLTILRHFFLCSRFFRTGPHYSSSPVLSRPRCRLRLRRMV